MLQKAKLIYHFYVPNENISLSGIYYYEEHETRLNENENGTMVCIPILRSWQITNKNVTEVDWYEMW